MAHPIQVPKDGGKAAARVRKICLALPDVTEKLAWGEPTWRAHGRLFAQMDTHHHGADHIAVWLPAPEGAQEELVESDPAHFFVPPYVGHKGWIGARVDNRPDWTLVAALIEQAYRHVGAVQAAARRRTSAAKRPTPPWSLR